jgi:hypothetical protein
MASHLSVYSGLDEQLNETSTETRMVPGCTVLYNCLTMGKYCKQPEIARVNIANSLSDTIQCRMFLVKFYPIFKYGHVLRHENV